MATHLPGQVPGDNTGTVHVNFQALGPGQMAGLTQVSGSPGPMADAIVVHGSRAGVRLIDQASASSNMLSQLGSRRPSGDPSVIAGQAEHTAPSTVGAQFRESPQRPGGPPGRFYQHEPNELHGPPLGGAA